MRKYSVSLIRKFQKLYKNRFGENIEHEAAERELYELAHLIKRLTTK